MKSCRVAPACALAGALLCAALASRSALAAPLGVYAGAGAAHIGQGEWSRYLDPPPMPLALGAGVSRAAGGPYHTAVEGHLLAMFDRSLGSVPEVDIREDPTWITSIHAGLELRGPAPDHAGPFLFVGPGLSLVSIGDRHIRWMRGSPWVRKGPTSLRPSVAAGLRVRLPRPEPDRPCMHASLRVIHVPDGHGGLTIVPILFGVAF